MDERESRNVLLDLRFAMHQVVWAGGVEGGRACLWCPK